jgi:membrane protease YdiL (CAAX protease family)
VVILQSIVLHVTVLLFVAWLFVRRWGWTAAFGSRTVRWPRAVMWGVLVYLAVLPFIGMASWLYQFGLRGLGIDTNLQDVALVITDESGFFVRAYMLFMAVVLAPLFEEMLFRGIALPVLVRRFGPVPGILMVSLCFAAIHHHLPSLAALFLLAVTLSLAYIRSGSLIVPVVIHSLFNAVTMGLLLFLR